MLEGNLKDTGDVLSGVKLCRYVVKMTTFMTNDANTMGSYNSCIWINKHVRNYIYPSDLFLSRLPHVIAIQQCPKPSDPLLDIKVQWRFKMALNVNSILFLVHCLSELWLHGVLRTDCKSPASLVQWRDDASSLLASHWSAVLLKLDVISDYK